LKSISSKLIAAWDADFQTYLALAFFCTLNVAVNFAGQLKILVLPGMLKSRSSPKNRKETCPVLQGISFPIAGLYPKYNKRNSPILDCCIFPAATVPSPHYRFLGDKMRGRENIKRGKEQGIQMSLSDRFL
jgi:hypothetical protein